MQSREAHQCGKMKTAAKGAFAANLVILVRTGVRASIASILLLHTSHVCGDQG